MRTASRLAQKGMAPKFASDLVPRLNYYKRARTCSLEDAQKNRRRLSSKFSLHRFWSRRRGKGVEAIWKARSQLFAI